MALLRSMKKKLLILLIICCSPISVSAQYDDSSLMMLELMRAASSYDHKLMEVGKETFTFPEQHEATRSIKEILDPNIDPK